MMRVRASLASRVAPRLDAASSRWVASGPTFAEEPTMLSVLAFSFILVPMFRMLRPPIAL